MPCNSPVDVLDILTFFVAVAALILSIRQFSYEKVELEKKQLYTPLTNLVQINL